MNINDNIKGSPIRSQRVYNGPTLGWNEMPIFQDRLISTAYTVQLYDSIILCQLALASILTLPNINTWLNREGGWFPIYVKDLLGNFSTRNLTIRPDPLNVGLTIDSQPTITMIADFSSVIIRPRSDYLGWYTT